MKTLKALMPWAVFALVLAAPCLPACAQSLTWVAGSTIAGTTTTATSPGGRFGGAQWLDADDNFWYFGGHGPDDSGNEDYRGDLWKFNINTAQWTHQNGSTTNTQYGIYGIRGQESPTNLPGARLLSAYWVDTAGMFWMYGGTGFGESEQGGLSDLWRFNPRSGNWTWISGSKLPYQNPVHGRARLAAASNTPGGRNRMAFWKDTAGNFWLYGGLGYDAIGSGVFGYLSDVWKYDVTSGMWTWMNGSTVANYGGMYSGDSSTFNHAPGGRSEGTTWTDGAGNFWLFGGSGTLSNGGGWFNDLWRYDPTTNLWSLVKGASVANSPGDYGNLGVERSANMPGARIGAVGWADAAGNLWLFSGYAKDFAGDFSDHQYSDIWKFNTKTGNWTWMLGSQEGNKATFISEQGAAYSGNFPGSRDSAAAFTDVAGNFWLFGGSGHGTTGFGSLNDVWKLQLSPTPNAACDQWEMY